MADAWLMPVVGQEARMDEGQLEALGFLDDESDDGAQDAVLPLRLGEDRR